jgi:deoxyribonuclease-4
MGPLLGAHVSIAGGFVRAVERALEGGFSAAQIFLKNCQQWRAQPLSLEEAREFQKRVREGNLYFFGHAGYLLNLSSSDERLAARSLEALLEEARRAFLLGLPFLVLHPGTRGATPSEEAWRRCQEKLRAFAALSSHFPVGIALESMPGSGSQIGDRIEELVEVIARLKDAGRFGICLDTAHLWAAGYDWTSIEGYQGLISTIEGRLGPDSVWALHLNDCSYPLGSRKDRHQHLGEGKIGLEPFRLWLQDLRWRKVPMVLETPKGKGLEEDKENLRRLRSLLEGSKPSTGTVRFLGADGSVDRREKSTP